MVDIVGPVQGLAGVPGLDPDDDIFSSLFDLGVSEGAQPLLWERAVRCDQCLTADTRQPRWGQTCPGCSGQGVRYLEGVQITGLFRARGQWLSYRRQGELELGDAELTTPLSVKPGFVDRLVRDRFTVLPAADDSVELRAFYPAATAVPFLFAGVQRAWRVQLQSDRRDQELAP